MEVGQGQNTKRGYFATRKCEKPSISSKCMFLLGLRAGGLWRCTPMSHTHLSNAAKVGDLISKVKIDSTSKSWHTCAAQKVNGLKRAHNDRKQHHRKADLRLR